MPKIKPVCMDCKERHPGCHGNCGRYLKAKEEYLSEKDRIFKAKSAEVDYMSYVTKSIENTRKKYAKQ